MIDLRAKAISGLISDTANTNIGVYPMSVKGGIGAYEHRTEWMEGWNAAVDELTSCEAAIVEFLQNIPLELKTLVEDLLLEDKLQINISDDGPNLVVFCSDIFFWGCADCEHITVEELKDFVACFEESPKWGDKLWVARKRGERPQGAVLEMMSPEDLKLFDACGPKKEVGFGNPVAHPNDK